MFVVYNADDSPNQTVSPSFYVKAGKLPFFPTLDA